MIWRHALPADEPALFFFKKGLWAPRWIPETDPTYHPDSHIELEFRHDWLDPVCVSIPLASVNREACEVAVAQAPNKGFEVRLEGQRPIFRRLFKLEVDTLYVAQNQIEDFLVEPRDRSSESDMMGQGFSTGPALPRIAVPHEVCDMATIVELREWFVHLSNIAVVVTPANLDPKQRWELRAVLGGVFVWDAQRGSVEANGDTTYASVQRWVDRYNKELAQSPADRPIGDLEIRPVAASSVQAQ